jgi:hypothetical protein
MFSELLKPETFGFFARFLLAGYVILSAQARFVGQERLAVGETLIGAVILSLINQMIYQLISLIVPALPLTPLIGQPAFYLEVLVLPAVLGFSSGWLLSRDWIPSGFRRFALPFAKPAEDAFEIAFLEARTPCFLIISFGDGRQVLGFFGPRSFVGGDRMTGGIHLERLYVLDEAGNWKAAEPARSCWVSLSDARSVEFVIPEGKANAQNAG